MSVERSADDIVAGPRHPRAPVLCGSGRKWGPRRRVGSRDCADIYLCLYWLLGRYTLVQSLKMSECSSRGVLSAAVVPQRSRPLAVVFRVESRLGFYSTPLKYLNETGISVAALYCWLITQPCSRSIPMQYMRSSALDCPQPSRRGTTLIDHATV